MVENSDADSRVMSNFIGLSTGVQILSVVLVCSSFFYMASKLRIAPKDVMAKVDSLGTNHFRSPALKDKDLRRFGNFRKSGRISDKVVDSPDE